MANDTGTGYASNWNVANVPGGNLITFSPVDFPFLARVSGTKTAASDEFAMDAQYALESFAQPAITEAGSVTAPTAIAYDRSNEVNAVQIFQKAVNVTYSRLSAANRLKITESGTSGYGYTPDPNSSPVLDELAFQVNGAREQLLGDFEYSALVGTYQKATSASVANKMRGIATACTSNTVAASSAQFGKTIFSELMAEMATSGAKFRRPTVFCNAYQKQKISDVFGFAPTDRRIGGLNIQMIETDFGPMEVVFTRNIATSTILVADMAYVYLVNEIVPGKDYMPDNLFFMEELSKTGASEKWQLYGQLSVDYGAEKLHGTITGLATA